MTTDTARRERAEKYIEDDTAVWANEWTWEGEDIINAYLAGSREEAAIKDAEWAEKLDRLQHENDALCGCVQSKHMDIEQKDAEIAALREELKDARSQITGLEYELIEAQEGEP